MKLVYYWLTQAGQQLAVQVQKAFGGILREKEDFTDSQIRQDFYSSDLLVFVMATGIVVRKIAPLLQSKLTDPAVIVLGQDGKHVISLLSGHVGGANRMTREIAALLQADPVITTATDLQDVLAFDEVAVRNQLMIENSSAIKHISSALLAGKTVTLVCDHAVHNLPSYPQIVQSTQAEGDRCVVISDRLLTSTATQTLFLRPKDLVIGIGCKKDIPFLQLEHSFFDYLQTYGLSSLSVKCIATIARKQSEPAILQLCEKYQYPLQIVPDEAIKQCADLFTASAFVEQVTGLPCVAEACSYLASGCGTTLTKKIKYTGMTFAACRSAMEIYL
jgi:cobalt-precorrin 5A hydrolase